MKYLAILTSMAAAQPAYAFDRMVLGDCQQAAQGVAELFSVNETDTAIALRSISATFDGWCMIAGSDPGFEDAEFETLIWRMDGTKLWTVDGRAPLGLQVRMTGLDPDSLQGSAPTDRPRVTAEVTVRQNPDLGQLIFERVVLDNEHGDTLTFSAVFDRVFLSSQSMMQVSLGSAVFKAGLLSMTLDGTHANPFAAEFSGNVTVDGSLREADVFSAISSLPDGVVDSASRAELVAFAEDLPRPIGTLDVVVGSERGLGLMQVGMAIYNSIESITAGESGIDLDLLLDGLSLSADWSPKDGKVD